MAFENIFKQRKYPFILALSVLLITVIIFVLTTTTNPIASVFFYQQQSRNSTVSHTTNDTATATTGTTPSPAQNNNTKNDVNNNTTTNNNDGVGVGVGSDSDNKSSGNNVDSNKKDNNVVSSNSDDNSNNVDSNSTNNKDVVSSDSDNSSNNNNSVDNNSNTNESDSDNSSSSNSVDNNTTTNGSGSENSSSSNDDKNSDNNGSDSDNSKSNNNWSDSDNNNTSSSNDDKKNTPDGSDSDNNNNNNNTSNNDDKSNTPSGSDSDNNFGSNNDNNNSNGNDTVVWSDSVMDSTKWEVCKFPLAADYIPCLDNKAAVKKLKSIRHMEHRERHCPHPPLRCLVPLPDGYKLPIPWPKSRDMIHYNNVPHPKLVEYKKEQNWVKKSGDYFVFPGGGTQFKEGVTTYIDFIQRTFPPIRWGKDIRVILDVGCGVASFGGYLLDKDVLTMSLAPKDEHEAQIQFALERGIPAVLSVIGTQKLPFPDDVYDLIHCARCRVHWDADGGKPLLELNRILRPGGFFIWSATPVYKKDERHQNIWQSMSNLTLSICWKIVARGMDSSGIGLVIFQKPISYSCYKKRKENIPPLCDAKWSFNSSWYEPLISCVSELPLDRYDNVTKWPKPWPERLQPESVTSEPIVEVQIDDSNKYWVELVSGLYLEGLALNWSTIRNVMDMNATYGGFATALIDRPVWVMNVIPIDGKDTLPTIFDRGLIGIYHDWCESFNTYPRTYDLLHASYILSTVSQRCDVKDVVVEIDRILRPEGYLIVQDSMEMIHKLSPLLSSLHWSLKLHQNQFLVGVKGFWRPSTESTESTENNKP